MYGNGYLYKFVIATPHQHPGYEETLFVSASQHDYISDYRKLFPEPPRGQAWDTAQRTKHAEWKRACLKWILEQRSVMLIKPTEI